MPTKPIYLSKTFWLNLIIAITALLPEVQSYIVAHPEITTMVFVAINIVLRLISNSKVELW